MLTMRIQLRLYGICLHCMNWNNCFVYTIIRHLSYGWGTYPSWGSSNDLNANQIFNSKLIEAGGKALGNNTTYRSSSEDGVGAYCINFNGGHIDGWEKHYGGSLTAVAIAKF